MDTTAHPPEVAAASGVCEACGTALPPAGRFCAQCGTSRSLEARVTTGELMAIIDGPARLDGAPTVPAPPNEPRRAAVQGMATGPAVAASLDVAATPLPSPASAMAPEMTPAHLAAPPPGELPASSTPSVAEVVPPLDAPDPTALVESPPVERQRRRMRGTVAVACLVVVILGASVATGLVLINRNRQRIEIATTVSSIESILNAPLTALAGAGDPSEVGEAGQVAADAERALQQVMEELEATDDPRTEAVRSLGGAGREMLTVVAGLEGFDESSAETWMEWDRRAGEAQAAMAEARARAAAAGLTLGDGTGDAGGGRDAVAAVSVAALSERTFEVADAMRADLSAVARLSDVDGLTEHVEAWRDLLEPVAEALAAGSDDVAGDTPTAWAQAELALLTSLQPLSELAPENLAAWNQALPALRAAASEADETAAEAGADLQRVVPMLARVDGVVQESDRRLAEWRGQRDRLLADRQAQLDALTTYEGEVAGHLTRYDGLRDDLADWTVRLERDWLLVTYAEAYDVLGAASADRQQIRSRLSSLAPPSPVQGAHSGLLEVLDDAIAAVDDATDGIITEEYCYYYCYYAETDGWRRFQSASGRITESFRSSEAAWRQAVAAERVRVESMAPPPAPDV